MAIGINDHSNGTSLNEPGTPAGTSERRRHRRQRVPFAYIELGDDNGGCIFDISPDGLALQAVGPSSEGQVSQMHFQFLQSKHWVTATGRVVWSSIAAKTAGIEFLDLSQEARAQIEAGISSINPAGYPRELHSEKEKISDAPIAHGRSRATPYLEYTNGNPRARGIPEPAPSTSSVAPPPEGRHTELGFALRSAVSPSPGVAAPNTARESKRGGARTRLLIWLLASLLAVTLMICFQLARRAEGFAAKAGSANEPHMGLKIEPIGNDWQLRWNADAPVIAKATKAHLLITDGGLQKFLDLDSSDLRSGTLIYTPLTNDVILRFEVDRPDSSDTVSESVRIEGPPISSPASPPSAANSK